MTGKEGTTINKSTGTATKKNGIDFDSMFYITKSETAGDAEGTWIVEGFAATVDLDQQGDVIKEEALSKAAADLLEYSTVLYNHDDERAIGKVLEAEAKTVEGITGLWVKVFISKSEPKIWQQIMEGVLNKFSIRGKILDFKNEYNSTAGKVIRVIYALKLIECSIVSLPANPRAMTLVAYVSKALSEWEEKNHEGGKSMIVKSIDQLLQSFREFCVSKNVDITKASKEELATLSEEFMKADQHLVDVEEAIAMCQALVDKLPDNLKEEGAKVMEAMIKAKESCNAVDPNSAPAEASASAEGTPPAAPAEGAPGEAGKSAEDADAEKAKGEAMKAESLLEQMLTLLRDALGKKKEDKPAEGDKPADGEKPAESDAGKDESGQEGGTGFKPEGAPDQAKSMEEFKSLMTELVLKGMTPHITQTAALEVTVVGLTKSVAELVTADTATVESVKSLEAKVTADIQTLNSDVQAIAKGGGATNSLDGAGNEVVKGAGGGGDFDGVFFKRK